MSRKICNLLFIFTIVAATTLPANAQPVPQETPEPGQVVIQTSPNASVYIDGQYTGLANPEGRLVIANPRPGEHDPQVPLTGMEDFQQKVTMVAATMLRIAATPEDLRRPSLGQVRENRKDGLKYVWILPGTFMMGCSPGDNECLDVEGPPHPVTITNGFWIGQTEVTVGAYKRFAAATGRQMPPAPGFNRGWANDNMPIVNLSWDDAREYCTWAGGRLPTEAEWEYAARGGSKEARYGDIDEIAWYSNNSGGQTHDVAQKRANGFGLFDVLGNVWEWVNDWNDDKYYQSSPSQDPTGPTSGQARVLRGGSWYVLPRFARVSDRGRVDPNFRHKTIGVRCGGEIVNP
jgi:formylglycine-generating enzyme required for sulfatase activity